MSFSPTRTTSPPATFMPCPERQCQRQNHGHGYYLYEDSTRSPEVCTKAAGFSALDQKFGKAHIAQLAVIQTYHEPLAKDDGSADPHLLQMVQEWNSLNQSADGVEAVSGMTAHEYIFQPAADMLVPVQEEELPPLELSFESDLFGEDQSSFSN